MACAQELCGLSKHLQANNRGLLLTNLNNLGLFEVPLHIPAHLIRKRITISSGSAVE